MDDFRDRGCPFTVVRRRAVDHLLDGLFWYARLAGARNWNSFWDDAFPSRAAYYTAVSRLRKAGLLVSEGQGVRPQLALTEVGKRQRMALHRPERMWQREWPGFWYMLMYDVPEIDRVYRNRLRAFLKQQRLGCLQKSIYITPTDIRPAFSDLVEAIGVDQFAYLFEARSVLGMNQMQIVRDAWSWEAINAGHRWFYESYEKQLIRLQHDLLDGAALLDLAREEMSAYITVMTPDPLLPEPLLPKAYLGGAVFALHGTITESIADRLQ
ncbi:MAG: hypothetical protein HN919_11630 [Verrucomicrobia bacterium]|nr:hypothetical protein [Verrucomicrobiota bacterium]MBT7066946.1 hypothetical protein [Verrucomicrobiota bacterium]MBT7701342.1 hypothetical protein [Verrucomicrobiota bacterium]